MKLAQKVSLGSYNQQKRVEFVKMRGPLVGVELVRS